MIDQLTGPFWSWRCPWGPRWSGCCRWWSGREGNFWKVAMLALLTSNLYLIRPVHMAPSILLHHHSCWDQPLKTVLALVCSKSSLIFNPRVYWLLEQCTLMNTIHFFTWVADWTEYCQQWFKTLLISLYKANQKVEGIKPGKFYDSGILVITCVFS